MKVMLKSVRLAFPKLFTAEQVNGQGEFKFSAAFPIVLDSDNAKALEAACKAVGKEKWKDKADAIYAKLVEDNRVCFSKKEKTSTSGDVFDGFGGHGYVNASSKTRPTVLDRNPQVQLVEADGRPYGGCYVNASIEIWAQDNKHGKRLNATLRGVQFVKDGDAFVGGAPASSDEFDDLGEGAAADDFM